LGELREELRLPTEGELGPAKRRTVVTRLGNRVMDEINRVTAVTPGAITALALLSHSQRGLPHAELVQRCRRLLGVLHGLGARLSPTLANASGQLRPESIRETVQMLIDAGVIVAHLPGDGDGVPSSAHSRKHRLPASVDAIYSPVDEKRLSLDATKNSIVHFFVERALIAIALSMSPDMPVARETVRDRVQKMSRLLKFEFRFRADAPFDEIFEETLADMVIEGVVQDEGKELGLGKGSAGWTGEEWLNLYSAILHSFLEGYRIAARSLFPLLKGPMTERELTKRALVLGQRMYLAGDITRRESVSKPVLLNAYQALIDQGYVRRQREKLALADSFLNTEAVRAIEGRISSYLTREGAE